MPNQKDKATRADIARTGDVGFSLFEVNMANKWKGTVPVACDICERRFEKPRDRYFFDFKMFMGPWALGCEGCFEKQRGKLGVGRGQKYDLNTMLLVEGGRSSQTTDEPDEGSHNEGQVLYEYPL